MTEPKKRGRPRKERWARLKGGFWRNDKVRKLSLSARGLLAMAWSYAADQATDGRVPLDLLRAWSGKRSKRLMVELEGFLAIAENGIDAEIHDWHEVNISVEEWEKRLLSDRKRKGFPTGNEAESAGVSDRKTTDFPATFQGHALDERRETRDEESLKRDEEHGSAVSEPAAPPVGERVRELEARYPASVVAEARAACALSRRNGRMADSVWLRTLEALAAYPEPQASDAMRTFAERYGDGEKDERYLLGIARSGAKRKTAAPGGYTRPAPREAFIGGDQREDRESFLNLDLVEEAGTA